MIPFNEMPKISKSRDTKQISGRQDIQRGKNRLTADRHGVSLEVIKL